MSNAPEMSNAPDIDKQLLDPVVEIVAEAGRVAMKWAVL